jgi:hypothetical protein
MLKSHSDVVIARCRSVSLAVATVLVCSAAQAATISVPAGGDLQKAIDGAAPGDTILLTPGATYVGNFVLREKDGTATITVRTGGADARLPKAGERIQPAHAEYLAKLQSPNRHAALRTAPRAHDWRLELLEFLPTPDGLGDIVMLGDGGAAQQDRTSVPHDLQIDRCYIHGDPQRGQKRGIALNSGKTSVTGSYVSDIKAIGQDTQAIAGWNGPGPYTIENNYLEAAGENFILGGSDPPIPNLVTEDVVFRNNHLAKPIAWRGEKWQVKNLFELKNARHVLVEDNLMENTWRDAQAGYAILLTPRNQDGNAPWVTIEDVTIRHNVIRHSGGGVQITGEDNNHPSGSTRRVTIVDNVFWDIDRDRWGGTGAFLLIGNGPADISIRHNTVLQSGNIVEAYGGSPSKPAQVTGFVFRDNIVRHNQYGVHGENRATGLDTLRTFFPDAVFVSNVIAGGDGSKYPAGNRFLKADELEHEFVNAREGDLTLKGSSRLRGVASDGRDPGAQPASASGTR